MITAATLTAQQAKKVDNSTLRSAATNGEEWLTHGHDYGCEARFYPASAINEVLKNRDAYMRIPALTGRGYPRTRPIIDRTDTPNRRTNIPVRVGIAIPAARLHWPKPLVRRAGLKLGAL